MLLKWLVEPSLKWLETKMFFFLFFTPLTALANISVWKMHFQRLFPMIISKELQDTKLTFSIFADYTLLRRKLSALFIENNLYRFCFKYFEHYVTNYKEWKIKKSPPIPTSFVWAKVLLCLLYCYYIAQNIIF